MCLIVTLVMLVLAIQNLINQQWSIGVLQLVIASGFALLLWRNIQLTRCERNKTCSQCSLPKWLQNPFKKKEK
jgi:hypothetical protein